ncbi:MAG: rRNA pseudouridine synthase [Anaerolineae bacterium]|nr:rRNA pseudouridine synthase [Anaerolineae bacterium]
MPEERVQKLLARAGIGSRRHCEELIRQGRVTVNGRVVKLGDRADPDADVVIVDGERVRISPTFTYVMLNKPRGVVSTTTAQRQETRPTVLDLVDTPARLYPVGRLDAESEGLVLLTDDGDLANQLTHPRYGHTKTYHVLVSGRPTEETLSAWRRGVVLEGVRTLPADIKVVRVENDNTWLEMVLREGRKRQVREMCAALGHPVRRLVRTHIGPLALGNLRTGVWRELTPEEVAQLKKVKAQAPRTKKRR